eukprot:11652707-Alexandrium_andersonii.AAC.1
MPRPSDPDVAVATTKRARKAARGHGDGAESEHESDQEEEAAAEGDHNAVAIAQLFSDVAKLDAKVVSFFDNNPFDELIAVAGQDAATADALAIVRGNHVSYTRAVTSTKKALQAGQTLK